jgi:hypothetical protein
LRARVQICNILLGQGFAPYTANFTVIDLGIAPVVLGLPFFAAIDPVIDWTHKRIMPKATAIIASTETEMLLPSDEEEPLLQDILDTIPKEFHDFTDVFSKKEANRLPPRRPFDHHIPLPAGTEPNFRTNLSAVTFRGYGLAGIWGRKPG